MKQEVVNLQNQKVLEILKVLKSKREVTFKAPTGSGKTYMMACLMEQILRETSDIVFIVSSLSKGGLAKQNYEKFKELSNNGTFNGLNPFLVQSDCTEGNPIIPRNYNVYVLPRDLYKDKSVLKDSGIMKDFLIGLTNKNYGLGKKICVIKDECHQATNNLDELSDRFFTKIINISATPNLKRGQSPDVQMTEIEAEQIGLIKRVEMQNSEDSLEDAISKFIDIKHKYLQSIGVNPCLIIQISNKEKADEEIIEIKKCLLAHQDLKWMIIMDESNSKQWDTNDVIKKLPHTRWKEYAKEATSTIDIIIFKMVISEGWDIPRACMLYQIRDSKSNQLDEQVIGRVRRNPKLTEFEKLSPETQKFISTAYVWGIIDKEKQDIREIRLVDKNITEELKIKTTILKPITQINNLDIDPILDKPNSHIVPTSIFDLYQKYIKAPEIVKSLAENPKVTMGNIFSFMNAIDDLTKQINDIYVNYEDVMELKKDENGNVVEVSLPATSYYSQTEFSSDKAAGKWVWERTDEKEDFSFDSEAEKLWLSILFKFIETDSPNGNEQAIKSVKYGDRIIYIIGKNCPSNSDVNYQYFLNGLHTSYPDFIMKDWNDRIHIFEVKSVNKSSSMEINEEEYKEKIQALRGCYKQASKLTQNLFYIPILQNDIWKIYRYKNGEEEVMDIESFKESILKR